MANLVPSARSHASRTASAFLFVGALLGGCQIEGADACDAHQVYQHGGRALEYAVCVCDEASGWVFDEVRNHGCRQCAAEQTIVNGRCGTSVMDAGMPSSSDAGRHEPTGVGAYCDSDSDCAPHDAKYCAVPTHSCLVQGCASDPGVCQTNAACCDYSALLAGFSLCLPGEQLVAGGCPMGGTKVSP